MRRHGQSRSCGSPDLPPFLGGAVGYFSYEMLHLIEEVPDLGLDDQELPDSYFVFYHTVLATDRIQNRSWIATTAFGSTEREAAAIADDKQQRVGRILDGLSFPSAIDVDPALRERRDAIVRSRRLSDAHLASCGIRPVVTRERYIEIVERAKDHIFAGDVFEVCTTQRFDADFTQSGIELYRVLRQVNDAPFASFLQFPGIEVISSSPERFLTLDRERWAETRPMKGTRPRGATPAEDRALSRDLATCEKDLAENIMIVDLARNDLGRVSEFGSISVPELRIVESTPFTHQLVSSVRGRIRRDVEPIDLIRAAFPGGSMTGAPKIEAMKIIAELEPVKRGVFSGAIGYLDFDGAFDLDIVIRTFVKVGPKLTFHVGGAVVADSEPEAEYQETLDKAHGLVTALELTRADADADASLGASER